MKDDDPWLQLRRPDKGEAYAVSRQHNVALISSKATVTVLTSPIEASSNKIGALPDLLYMLHRAYTHTKMPIPLA